MASYIGIRAGNSSACVAVGKSGKISVVANSHGDRLTPSMVTYTSDEALVGYASKQVSHRYISETIKHFNGLIGKAFGGGEDDTEWTKLKSGIGADIEKKADGKFTYCVKTNGKSKSITPEGVLELLLGELLETAMSQTGSDAKEAVFTAPIGFPTSYHEALLKAATNAGFEVLRIISEPAAACLAYGICTEKNSIASEKILVFRVGGLSQDGTLLSSNNGILSTEKSVSRKSGGDTLTDIIANHFASLFKKQCRVDITSNIKSMHKLKINAENCKHILSSMPSANCHIDSLYDGMDFSCNLSRSMFEMLANEHLQNLLNPLKDLVSTLGIEKSLINKVILTGGTCSIPRLQKLVSDFFPNSEILSSVPPSEVNAIGAAVEAGILVNQDSCDISEEDCLLSLAPVDIHLKFGDETDVVVKQRTVLPVHFERIFLFPKDRSEETLLLSIIDQDSGNSETVLGSMKILPEDCENEFTCDIKYSRNGNIALSCGDLITPKSFAINAMS